MWQWLLFEYQHQRKAFPWDFIWSSINTSYFHFKMQILVYFQTEMKLLKISKRSPFSKGIQGAWWGTQYAKKSQMMQRTWYRKKLIPLVQVRHQGHNQQIQKRSCREKVSCTKENPWTTVGDSCYPLSFHHYCPVNNSKEQRWRAK